jgi:hypothetical protein
VGRNNYWSGSTSYAEQKKPTERPSCSLHPKQETQQSGQNGPVGAWEGGSGERWREERGCRGVRSWGDSTFIISIVKCFQGCAPTSKLVTLHTSHTDTSEYVSFTLREPREGGMEGGVPGLCPEH